MAIAGARATIAQSWLPLALALPAFAAYVWFLWTYAINAPFQDDILDILKFIAELNNSDTLSTKINAFLAQHNDHRTLASRLIYSIFYSVEGNINFRSLTFIANIGLLMLTLLLYSQTKKSSERWLVFLPVVFLLFQLKLYGITVWSMAAFAFYFVYVYGIAAIFCLHSPTPLRFTAAVILGILSTYSIASGQVVWVAGLLCLLHQSMLLRRISVWYAVVWIAIAMLVLALYRAGLETPNTWLALVKFALATPWSHTEYFLGMLGSAVSFEHLFISQCIGALLMLLLVWQSLQHYRSGLSKLHYACWFIVLSAVAVVLGRAPYSQLEYSQESRYGLASMLLISCIWLDFAERFQPGRVRLLLAIVSSAAVCAASYAYYMPKFNELMARRIAAFNRADYRVFGQPAAHTNAIVVEAIEAGIYHPPPRPLLLSAARQSVSRPD